MKLERSARAFGLLLASAMQLAHAAEGPEQTEYPPPGGKGPVVVVLSGQTGTTHYRGIAKDIAALGYDAVLVDGKDILNSTGEGGANLTVVIEKALATPAALPGKVAVVGFSQGGGGALAHAVQREKTVAAIVAFYPATSWIKEPAAFGKRVRVPLLVLTGEKDNYKNCCLISSARALEAAAKAAGAPFELVSYPYADHGFVAPGSGYRTDDAEDAMARMKAFLARYLPPASR